VEHLHHERVGGVQRDRDPRQVPRVVVVGHDDLAELGRHPHDCRGGDDVDVAAGLKVRRRDADQIVSAITVAPRLVERLAGGDADPAEIVALADPYAPDAPLLALALADSPALRDYFLRLRDVRLDITGADLAELGLAESPKVGEVLDELRRRKLRGDLDGRESELAAARELIGG